jgi:hypothetical protein
VSLALPTRPGRLESIVEAVHEVAELRVGVGFLADGEGHSIEVAQLAAPRADGEPSARGLPTSGGAGALRWEGACRHSRPFAAASP